MTPKVVVLIPMFNKAELTDKCIEETLKNAGLPIEIIVIDDGSSVPYSSVSARTIRIDRNSGFTKAVNTGLRELRLNYDYVLLLNNDTLPQPDFLKAMVERAETDRDIGIVSSIRIGSMDPWMAAAGGADIVTGLVYASKDPNEWTEPMGAGFVPFCSVLLRRDMVEYVGLLDESMRNHCSDNDYCIRAIFANYKIIVEPKSAVFHHQSVTLMATFGQVDPSKDQKMFMGKWFGAAMNQILEVMPLNGQTGLRGKLRFETFEKQPEQPLIVVAR